MSKRVTIILAAMIMVMAFGTMAAFAGEVEVAAPKGVTVKSESYNSLKIQWKKVSNADGYIVHRYNRSKDKYEEIAKIENVNKLSYIDKKLTFDKSYAYRVSAFQTSTSVADSQDEDSKIVVSKRSTSAKCRTKLEKPRNVKATGKSSSSIKVQWSKVNGAQGYVVYRYNPSSKKYNRIATLSGSSKLSYTNRNLPASTRKAYRVKAYRIKSGNKVLGDKSSRARAYTKKSQGVERLMSVAKSKLGCPYVLGAAGPSAFDCSGYVYWVYKNANVSNVKFSRGTAQGIYYALNKYKVGSSLSSAKRGDILFYGTSTSNIWHTGIYYGGGDQIHAFSTSGQVDITPVSWSTSNKNLVAVIRLPMK